jgi:hypothetical protein
MPALLKLALIIALVLLVLGLGTEGQQFLLCVGLLVLAGAGVSFSLRRLRTQR